MTADVSKEMADAAGRRSSTWWLLSRLVMEQPQAPWLDELEAVLQMVHGDPQAPLVGESASLLSAIQSARSHIDGLTALAVDRTSLLAGVLHNETLPAPYESAALGLEMNCDRVLDVIRCYEQAGLEDFCRELGPPDYLGTELRFMSVLAYQEMLAHQAADIGLAAQWLQQELDFLQSHILTWVPDHCQRLRALAKTPFYQAAGALLAAACVLDHADLLQVADALAQPLAPSSADAVVA